MERKIFWDKKDPERFQAHILCAMACPEFIASPMAMNADQRLQHPKRYPTLLLNSYTWENYTHITDSLEENIRVTRQAIRQLTQLAHTSAIILEDRTDHNVLIDKKTKAVWQCDTEIFTDCLHPTLNNNELYYSELSLIRRQSLFLNLKDKWIIKDTWRACLGILLSSFRYLSNQTTDGERIEAQVIDAVEEFWQLSQPDLVTFDQITTNAITMLDTVQAAHLRQTNRPTR